MIKQFLLGTLLGLTLATMAGAEEAAVSAPVTAPVPTAVSAPVSAPVAVPEPKTESLLGLNLIDSTPLNEVWIDSSFASYHWDRDKNLNGNNYGLGAEYRFSTVSALTAGRFYNSDRAYSNYAGVYYQPLQVGPVRIGAVVGGFNGYPNMKNGGWFLAAVPMVSADWGRFGINLAIVPSLQNRLYGAISLQVKIKVWD